MPNLSDIAGSAVFVDMLREHVVGPLKSGDESGKKVIIYGPPGTGKTFVAKALAGELGLGFKSVGPYDAPKDVINAAKYASRQSLVFFDSLEWVNYRPVLMDALLKMPKDVLVIGATNYPWRILNLMGEGFNSLIFMAEPDIEARKGILEHNLGIAAEKMDIDRLAEMTVGYTASDIHYLCEWVSVAGHVSQERLEAAVGRYRTLQLQEWVVEAKANVDKLDRAAFAPLLKWLEGR